MKGNVVNMTKISGSVIFCKWYQTSSFWHYPQIRIFTTANTSQI